METAKKKRKILYLITKANFGGAQRYVYDLAANLPKDKFEALVAAGEGEGLFERLSVLGIRTIKLPYLSRDIKLLYDFKTFFGLLELLKDEKPDIVHLNSSKIGGLGVVAGRFAGVKKIIFTAHSWAFNEERPFLEKLAIAFIHWLTVVLCHQTIVVSETTMKQIRNWPFVARKLTLIYNGIGDIDFKNRARARDYLARDRNSAFWIGTISELHKNKGLDVAIEAYTRFIKNCPDSFFVIIGDGEEKENLKQLATRTGASERIFFAGKVANASEYLKAFDVFVLSSRTEGLPYVILEAGLAKVPIIATSVGGVPEIIESRKSGILTRPGNAKEIYTGLLHLARKSGDGQTYAKNLYHKVEKNFSIEKMVKKTVVLYK